MKKVKEFYVILSKDKKHFTETSGSPYKLESSQICKVQCFKTKEDAEVMLQDLPIFRRNNIEKCKQAIEFHTYCGNKGQVEIWNEEAKREQRALDTVEGASIKKVILSWEVEE